MYNPDIIIGTESWLREEIGNAEIFRVDFTTSRRDRNALSVCVLSVLKYYYPLRTVGGG
jgi:hypothetical protein